MLPHQQASRPPCKFLVGSRAKIVQADSDASLRARGLDFILNHYDSIDLIVGSRLAETLTKQRHEAIAPTTQTSVGFCPVSRVK